MATACHCAWIEVDPAYTDKRTLENIINQCRENEVILVLKEDTDKLEETRVHGVHLGIDSPINPRDIRNKLGGHPIIGVSISENTPLAPLKKADVDYVVLDGYPEVTNCDTVSALSKAMFEQDAVLPIVVEGRINPEDIKPLIEAGASGINIDINSLKGPEYELSLKTFMAACQDIMTRG